MNYKVKPITVAVGAVMTALSGAAFADTEEDPFALEATGEGYDLLADAHGGEGECGEGKCGDNGDDGGEAEGDGGDAEGDGGEAEGDGGDAEGDGGEADGGEEAAAEG